MVTLIIGKKGSGKTKKLISLANEAVEASNGNVVVIEKGSKLTFDVTHKARLIDTEQYSISGYDAFFGFLSGLCAGNYDVTDVLVDSTLKIGGQDFAELSTFIEKINVLALKSETKFTFLISADEKDLPESLDAVSVKI
jgi:energy-coupling factor transporter ATP-binding protein EcfA2